MSANRNRRLIIGGLLSPFVTRTAFGQSLLNEKAANTNRGRVGADTANQKPIGYYTTKPIRIVLGPREYVIPANYFNPVARDDRDTINIPPDRGFGFSLFLPAYSGYTVDGWGDPFDPRRIHVNTVSLVDKTVMIPMVNGTWQRITPANYGDPKAQFENIKSLYEGSPSLRMFGLEGFRRMNSPEPVLWTGKRATNEFFFFESSLAPGEGLRPGITNPLCTVRYYSRQEDTYVAYSYSMQNIAQWLEIDTAIWTTIQQWRVK